MKGEKYRWHCCRQSKDTWRLCVLSARLSSRWVVSIGHTLTSRMKLTLGSGLLIACSLLGCSDDGGLDCNMV